MRWHRDLLKHSSIYSLGEILTRLTSLLLLPIYTRYLAPADYGVMAIIDLLTGLLAIVLGGGLASAVSRFHFDYEDEQSQRAVWWTGLTFVAVVGGIGFAPSWLLREQLAGWTLGESVVNGGQFYTLALGTMWLACIEQIPMVYLRVRKWSGRFVLLSLFRLGLNIALNLSFLAQGWGVAGVLWGNFLTGVVLAFVSVGVLAWELKRFQFDVPLLRKMLQFGSPLIVIAFLSLLMHQADRWILHRYVSMAEVGIYSLAYRIGQGLNQILLLPFASIWGVMIYEVAKQPNAKSVYARVFGYYTKFASLFLLAGALGSRMLISIVATEEYAAAADIIPVILLAYLAFSWNDHFRIPVLLKKRTLSMVPVSVTATVVNLAANFALVPLVGWNGSGLGDGHHVYHIHRAWVVPIPTRRPLPVSIWRELRCRRWHGRDVWNLSLDNQRCRLAIRRCRRWSLARLGSDIVCETCLELLEAEQSNVFRSVTWIVSLCRFASLVPLSSCPFAVIDLWIPTKHRTLSIPHACSSLGSSQEHSRCLAFPIPLRQ